MKKILIIDDNPDVLLSLKILFKSHKFEPVTFEKPHSALAYLQDHSVDVVLQDMNFTQDTTSGKEGLELLLELKKRNPTVPIILFTAWATLDLAIEGMKLGASNFFTKPWDNETLIKLVTDTLVIKAVAKKNLKRYELDQQFDFSSIIGESEPLLEQLETAGMVASTDASMLIRGENGTGKDILAHAVHHNSLRKDRPFIKVNIGGVSSTLFDSEMFGHVKGAFTDAKEDRIGRFEQANGGTIFLDEIGDLSMDSQVKLLRVLQEGRFERLGSSKTIDVNIRVIAATNTDLEQSIADGIFREDLYYRLNVIELTLPPLRERGNDQFKLAECFLNEFCLKYKKSVELDEQAREQILLNPWKGNIRELRHTIERAVLVSRTGTLQFHFKEDLRSAQLPAIGSMTLDEIEKEMILKTLRFTNYHISKTAELLGINRTSLYRRLEKYEIEM